MTEIQHVAKELQEEMEKYSRLVVEEFEEAKKVTSKELVEDLKRTSPERRPSYKKGWRMKKTSKGYIVHNATDYQLTHLLEHGHVIRKGTKRVGETDEHSHIRPAEQTAIKNFEKRTKKAIKK